jgi:hypothetical protein
MKAVNLIPSDSRGRRRAKVASAVSTGGAGGLSAYGLLVVLAVAVLVAGAWAMTGKQLSGAKADLAHASQAATAAEANATSLGPYTAFAALSRARVETVSGLVKGRFDWSHGLREVARVVPADVDLISLVGTATPNSSVQGAGGSGPLRAALPVPAIDLIGCAKTQSHVARLLARLRAIDGVQRVSLSSSEKSDSASLSDTDCRRNSRMPQFQLTVFFQAQEGIVPSAAATTADAAAPATAPAGGTK